MYIHTYLRTNMLHTHMYLHVHPCAYAYIATCVRTFTNICSPGGFQLLDVTPPYHMSTCLHVIIRFSKGKRASRGQGQSVSHWGWSSLWGSVRLYVVSRQYYQYCTLLGFPYPNYWVEYIIYPPHPIQNSITTPRF